jgi:hypothetical protein
MTSQSVRIILGGFPRTPLRLRPRRAWPRSAPGCGSGTRWSARQPTGRRQTETGGRYTRHWLAAAAAFGEYAAALTPDPARPSGRTLSAVEGHLQAGVFGKALGLLAAAEAGPLDERQSARADLLRGQIACASGHASDAALL